MARYTGPVCKLCRREGVKLFLKGDRCTSGKCPFDRIDPNSRNRDAVPAAPGQHGAARKKLREYGMQLREKEKVKRYYGVLERQFHNYFDKADRMEGMTGENLLILLERRLDNAVYHIGFGKSRAESRQLTLHDHICVNGKKVNIPSYNLRVGDVISVNETCKGDESVKALIEAMATANAPKWLEVDAANATAKVVALPTREDVGFDFNEQLIVELYSK